MKIWKDESNRDGVRPKTITLHLFANGEEIGSQTLAVTDDDQQSWTFGEHPVYENGKRITYELTEDPVDGYYTSWSGTTVTNYCWTDWIELPGVKVWDDEDNKDGKRPEAIIVSLMDGDEVSDSAHVEEGKDGNWSWNFYAPRYVEGMEGVETQISDYVVLEEAVDGYSTDYSGSGTEDDPFVVTNTRTPAPDPDSYTITYKLNGGNYDGNTDDVLETHYAGEVITIRDKPTREGYTFLYWKGSEYYPGDSYTVVGDHTLVAQWEKDDNPTTPTTRATTTTTRRPLPDTSDHSLFGWLFGFV